VIIVATYRGLVFSLDKNSAVVATPQNAVYKINRTSTMYIGKEVVFTDKDIINNKYFIKRYFAAAACFCLILSIAASLIVNFSKNLFTVKEYAYICMDINPSVEFTIDKVQKVLKVDSLNKDAEIVLKGANLNGLKLEEAFVKLYGICKEKAFIDDKSKVYILISGAANPDNKEYKKQAQREEDVIENILVELKENIKKTSGSETDVVALEIEPQTRTRAFEHGVSPAKFALYSEIVKNGRDISIEEIKGASTEELVKIYNDIQKNIDSSKAAKPTSTVVEENVISPSPTPELTPTPSPSVTETPTASSTGGFASPATPAEQIVTKTQNIPVKTPEPKPLPQPDMMPKPAPTQIIPGTGLRGDYFDNIDLTNFKLTRVDKTIEFFWGVNSPAKEIRNDESYSVRWRGKIRPLYSEEYTFYISRDNGVRLWIDNKLIIDKWDNLVSRDETGKIFLEAGKLYDIKLEYFNNTGNGFVKLEWSSASTVRAIVPTECLYPAEPENYESSIPGKGIGLFYEYFDEDNLTNPKEKGIDSVIDFNWGVGSPSKSINQDQKFSVRWTGFIQVPYDGDYVFYVSYDDGAGLWIDRQLLIDKWTANEINTAKTKAISLKAGQRVEIMLLYRNTGLAGSIRLEWEGPGIERSVVPTSCLYPR